MRGCSSLIPRTKSSKGHLEDSTKLNLSSWVRKEKAMIAGLSAGTPASG